MTEQEYLDDMFCKIAMISFRRGLEDRGIGELIDLDQAVKTAATQKDLFDLPKTTKMERLRGAVSSSAQAIKSAPGAVKKWLTEDARDPMVRSSGQRTMFAETSPGILMREGLTPKTKSLGSTMSSGLKVLGTRLMHGTTEANPEKGFLPAAGRMAGRGMAAMDAINIGANVLRNREEGEGFFESVGRRTGNIGETLIGAASGATPATRAISMFGKAKTISSVGAMVAGATGHNRISKALKSIPSIGDAGAFAGKAVDKGVSAVSAAGRAGRKAFGGGLSYSQQKSQALDGQKWIRKAEYQ